MYGYIIPGNVQVKAKDVYLGTVHDRHPELSGSCLHHKDHGTTCHPCIVLCVMVQWTGVGILGNFNLGGHLPKAAHLVKGLGERPLSTLARVWLEVLC